MGLGSGNKTRKNSKHGVGGETRENLKKGKRPHELLHAKLVLNNGNYHLKKSSSARRDSHDDQERDIIFYSSSSNLPPSSNLSLSINLPPSSYSSLSINLPSTSQPSLSLKIQSSSSPDHSVTSLASSNTLPSFRDSAGIEEGSDQNQTLTFPVPDVIRESHPLDVNSIMKSPLGHQIMDRSGQGGRGYDPTRIPLTIFAKEPSSGVEWSATSTDSLFSLHLGRSNSLSRDQILSFGDADFAFSPPLPIAALETDNSRPSVETDDSYIDIVAHRTEENEAIDEIKKDETAATDTDKEAEENQDLVPLPAGEKQDLAALPAEEKQDLAVLPEPITKSSFGGEESSHSFVFPILADGGGGSRPVSAEQNLQKPVNEQKFEPFTASPGAAKASRKSKSKSWFLCFSCSLIWSCLSCRPCTSCCCSCWPPCHPCSGFACHSCRCIPCLFCSCSCPWCSCSSCDLCTCPCHHCSCFSCSLWSFFCCRPCS